MTPDETSTSTPFAELDVPARGDYTLTVDISIDRQDDRFGVPDQRAPFDGDYTIAAGREHGRWSLMVWPTTTDQYGDIQNAGPPVVDLRDQTDGPDPLALLRALLTGGRPS